MNWFDEFVQDNQPPAGTGGETTPPTAGATFPLSGDYAVAKDGSVVIPVVDASSAVAMVAVAVRFAGVAKAETIYLGNGTAGGYMPGYANGSAISGTGAATVGFTLTVRRDDSWPRGVSATFTVRAADALGNFLS